MDVGNEAGETKTGMPGWKERPMKNRRMVFFFVASRSLRKVRSQMSKVLLARDRKQSFWFLSNVCATNLEFT